MARKASQESLIRRIAAIRQEIARLEAELSRFSSKSVRQVVTNTKGVKV